MKKEFLKSASLVFAILLIAVALASSPGTASAAQTFKVDANMTLGEIVSPSWAAIFKELEQRSNGRLKITTHWSNSLMSIPEIPRGVSSGMATFSNLPSPNYVDILPLNTRILQLPYMGLKDPVESAEIYMQLYDEFPQMAEEMAQFNMKVLGATTLGVYDLHLVDKKEVRVPADLRGRRINPFKVEFKPMLEKFGAAATFVSPGQMYESLEKGVLDGYWNNWAFKAWFGLSDLINQSVKLDDYGAFHEHNIIVVNADFYKSLPADLQKLWNDIIRTEGGYARMWNDTAALVERELANAKRKGSLLVELTPQERQLWKDELAYTHKLALDEINARRGDKVANQIYDRALAIIAQKNAK